MLRSIDGVTLIIAMPWPEEFVIESLLSKVTSVMWLVDHVRGAATTGLPYWSLTVAVIPTLLSRSFSNSILGLPVHMPSVIKTHSTLRFIVGNRLGATFEVLKNISFLSRTWSYPLTCAKIVAQPEPDENILVLAMPLPSVVTVITVLFCDRSKSKRPDRSDVKTPMDDMFVNVTGTPAIGKPFPSRTLAKSPTDAFVLAA